MKHSDKAGINLIVIWYYLFDFTFGLEAMSFIHWDQAKWWRNLSIGRPSKMLHVHKLMAVMKQFNVNVSTVKLN